MALLSEVQTKRIYGKYEITSDGKVFSYMWDKRKELKQSIRSKNDPYLHVGLCINGVFKTTKVHRLVAEAFIPNSNKYTQVNHSDGNKLNNNIDNLEWCTSRQNAIHARDMGLTPRTCKINMEIANKIRELHKTGKYVQKELGSMFGITRENISRIVNNKTWC